MSCASIRLASNADWLAPEPDQPDRAFSALPFARTGPLRREIEAAFPRRPFTLRFWDGNAVEATEAGGPTFDVLSPEALAHVLRAPGELGLGRAYVLGLVEVDDIDKALQIVDTFKPPSLSAGRVARLALATLGACGLVKPPRAPASELRLQGERHTIGRDRRRSATTTTPATSSSRCSWIRR